MTEYEQNYFKSIDFSKFKPSIWKEIAQASALFTFFLKEELNLKEITFKDVYDAAKNRKEVKKTLLALIKKTSI